MATTIKVRMREVYGNKLLYPANDAAAALADIAGTTTLPIPVLRLAKAKLGLEVEAVECDAAWVKACMDAL